MFCQAQQEFSSIPRERFKCFSVAQTLPRAAELLSGGYFGFFCMVPGSHCSRGGFCPNAWRADIQMRVHAGSAKSACSVSSSLEIQCTLPMLKCLSQDFLWALFVQLPLSRFASAPAYLSPSLHSRD